MKPSGEKLTRQELAKEVKATERDLRQATRDEEVHFRANDQWDEDNEVPKVVPSTSPFWKGKDWTHEEKQTLHVAQSAIAVSGLVLVGQSVAGVFRTIAAQEGLQAADLRNRAEELETGNVTEVNEVLRSSAYHGYVAQISDSVAMALAAIGAIGAGCYQFWMVWSRHAENVQNLNRPDVTKKREALAARLAVLQKKLDAELKRLDDLIGSDSN